MECDEEVRRAEESLWGITRSVGRMEEVERRTGRAFPRVVIECMMECASREMKIIEANAMWNRVEQVRLW